MGDLRIREHVRIGINVVEAEIWTTCPDCGDLLSPGELIAKLDFKGKRNRTPWRCRSCTLREVGVLYDLSQQVMEAH